MCRSIQLGLIALVLVTSASFSTTPRAQERERWEGLMLNSTGFGPTAGNFQIEINEWSTAEEVEGYAQLLADKGPRELEGAISGKRNGFIRMNSVGTPLAITRSFPGENGGRIIHLVAAREIGIHESNRMADFAFGMVELQLDSEGNGTGTVLPATELYFDRDGVLVIRAAGRPQVELTEVTKR